MVSQANIRRQLISYIRNSISLADFEDWLVSHTSNMHLDSDQDTIDLVDDIELALSEYSESYLTIDELRDRLLESATNIVANVNMGAPVVITSNYRGATSRAFFHPVSLQALA